MLLLTVPASFCACAGAQGNVATPDRQTAAQPEAPAPQTGSVHGSVETNAGAVITGADVQLTSAASGAQLRQRSGPDGDFAFSAVLPGEYQLDASLPGFSPMHQQLHLAPGQDLSLGPLVLSLATISISVDAVTSEELAAQQVHDQEQQRLVGLLPNFYVSYVWDAQPLTTRQKFRLATHNVLDPGNLALVGTVAGVQQAANAFPGYGQGAAGYGKRYGADLGNLVGGTYMGGAVLPTLFHQDPRYFFKGTGTWRSRALYAISRTVITRGDNGRNQVNYSGMLGDLSASALSNLYYPASDRQGATLFMENGILAIAGDAMNNVVQELILPRFTTRAHQKKVAVP